MTETTEGVDLLPVELRSRSKPAAMRACRLVAPGRAETVEAPLPQPGRLQARIRLEGCGLCGSSLAVWQGRPWFQYPLEAGAPGHEGWGRIDKIGTGVKNFHCGDRVAFLSSHGLAEYDVAEADQLVRVPAGESVFPGEALACAVNVFQRSGIEPGMSVAVVGVGFLGALLVQLAAGAGARVIAVSRRAFALEIARRAGAVEALELRDRASAAARVAELTGGSGCEVVIEAAGAQEALDLAGECARVRGRLVIAGYHQESRTVNMQLWNWRGLDVVNAHERDPKRYVEGMSRAAEAIAKGSLDAGFLYTHRFALEETPAAFAALESRPEGFLKAWIRPAK